MAHFDDVVMPLTARFGAQSTPEDAVKGQELPSGVRKAVRIWTQKLRILEQTFRLDQADAAILLAIWEIVSITDSFLARDWRDWNSGINMVDGGEEDITKDDQPLINQTTDLAQGNGSEVLFQMEKHYTVGSVTHRREIIKPDAGILVAVNGVLQTEGVDYTINLATGVIDFTIGGAPPSGQSTTWGGTFKIPVQFLENDAFTQSALEGDLTGIADLRFREVVLA